MRMEIIERNSRATPGFKHT